MQCFESVGFSRIALLYISYEFYLDSRSSSTFHGFSLPKNARGNQPAARTSPFKLSSYC